MYPFFFGPAFGTESLALDDMTSISRLYPEANYFATTAAVAGSILAPNGTTRLSGVNVIARNVANPFLDAVSALSGDFTDETDPAASAVVGTYRFTGLTPGAQYAVFVDEILDGGFSTPPRTSAGTGGVPQWRRRVEQRPDWHLRSPWWRRRARPAPASTSFSTCCWPGEPLPVGDDGFVELFPRFPIDFCGAAFRVAVRQCQRQHHFRQHQRRVLGIDACPPERAGPDRGPLGRPERRSRRHRHLRRDRNSFTVRWQGVPEFPAAGANTFSITINKKNLLGEHSGPVAGNPFSITYGALSAADGLAGYSCGSALRAASSRSRISARSEAPSEA